MRDRKSGLARSVALIALVVFAAAACSTTGGGGTSDDLLSKVKAAGKIVMSTDPEYPPQSALTTDGGYEGFDIDVGTEIAKRLGVDIAFETPSWEAITAGSWSGRWDFSVGSMTITSDREKVIAFTKPYYYTPAQMAVLPDSGIASLDGLAGKVICVGGGTTYLQWLEGTLDFGTESPQTQPPDGSTATTLNTDRNCAESWQAGRRDFDGWLSSSTTVQGAIDEGIDVVKLGDPVFNEPLAVAFDKSGPDPTSMVAEVNKILEAMHSDGTLKTLSDKWFGEDLTTRIGG
jgi:polar amino acid transport system substrate-binding protein